MEYEHLRYKTLSISKAFTTERKHRKTSIDISRKGSIVKERCRQLTNIALNLFPDRHLSDQDLTDLIQRYIGGDKETIRAYKGYYGIVKRSKHSGEGYVLGQSRKGYLEIFGFMHRISRLEWFIHTQMKLPSSDSDVHTNEGLSQKQSKEKISISQRGLEGSVCSGLEHGDKVLTENKINNNNTERERNFAPKIFPKISPQRRELNNELSPEAEALSNAIPLDSEPDLARLKCPKIEWKADSNG